jgi:KUP system potassium uptake protein
MSDHAKHINKITLAGLVVTLGIIYGDIGTSPLYVMKAIIGDRLISRDLVLGGVSCIFWTLTLQTTIKYIILTLRADNKGEGGIFALYALVRRTKVKWLLFPAIIGGAALLGDGIITPAISVSSAIEGLEDKYPFINTIPIIIGILFVLFAVQQFGTKSIGNLFGPVMLLWFLMLTFLGISQITQNMDVLAALNPFYAFKLLTVYPGGFWILGAVFLCTTGAEALYSDLGHCGKQNIRVSWIFVKSALLLNYLGQAAWLLKSEGHLLEKKNPFYEIMPEWFFITGFVISTIATIVASQALISGSFTLINEAIRLNLWPKVRINYPTDLKGQLYIPSINWLLFIGCAGIVLYFKESSKMEAAYGMTIIIGMLMTSTLLVYFMGMKRYSKLTINAFIAVYLCVELAFLVSNLEKIPEGGWISLFIATVIALVMWAWYDARKIRNSYVEFVQLNDYLDLLCELKQDLSVPKYATHLVFLTSANYENQVESKIIYSILQKQPKRADIYWFLHVDVVDEPYRMEYRVNEIINDSVIRVDFYLGFRVAPRINLMFRKVVQDLVKSKEVDIVSRYESLNRNQVIGDFRFIVLEKFLSNENDLPFYEKIILDIYFMLKSISLSEENAFGLDTSSVHVEKVPLIISPVREIHLKRIVDKNQA